METSVTRCGLYISLSRPSRVPTWARGLAWPRAAVRRAPMAANTQTRNCGLIDSSPISPHQSDVIDDKFVYPLTVEYRIPQNRPAIARRTRAGLSAGFPALFFRTREYISHEQAAFSLDEVASLGVETKRIIRELSHASGRFLPLQTRSRRSFPDKMVVARSRVEFSTRRIASNGQRPSLGSTDYRNSESIPRERDSAR